MAAVIPFNTIEGVVAGLAKVDIMHKHMAQENGSVPEEYFLAPLQINVVSQGDELLWDGASKFVNSDTLRFKVGDSVKCLAGDQWVGGALVLPPSSARAPMPDCADVWSTLRSVVVVGTAASP